MQPSSTTMMSSSLPSTAKTTTKCSANKAGSCIVKSGDGNFELQWSYSNNTLHFKMKCKGLGWCAVGFSSDPGDGSAMRNYDVAAGGLMANNMAYLTVSIF